MVIMVEVFGDGLKSKLFSETDQNLFGADIKNLNLLINSRTDESKRKQFRNILIFLYCKNLQV
jgi:hypothetical protein